MGKLTEKERKELDSAARANLTDPAFRRYCETRDRLIAEGTDDVEAILRGFIWAESEPGD